MRKAAVRHGDPTTTRGFVIALTSTIHDDNKKIALSGDRATCGACEGSFAIIGTGEGMSENGRAVVVEGDPVLCPCGENKVIAGHHPGVFLTSHQDSMKASSAASVPLARDASHSYDQHFRLIDQDGGPLDGALVHLQTPGGVIQEIKTTSEGKTPVLTGDSGDSITLHISYRGR